MNLDVFIENKFPKFKQSLNCSSDFSIDYYFQNEPNRKFHLIPKTNDLEIHRTIVDYISSIKYYTPPCSYVAECKNLNVLAMNDVGSINVVGPNDIIFSDISTRYSFENYSIKKTLHIKGKNVLLSMDSSSNYFHWMIQVLPRIHLLNEHVIKWSDINKILIPQIRGNFITETLNLLGVPPDKLIQQESGTCYSFEKLIIPSKPNNHIHFQKWSIEFIRNLFLPKSKKSKHKKILILRKKASKRFIENESQMIKKLATEGFEPFHLEDLTVLDQVSLFRGATHIVSAHGAALTNLCFCEPHTKVIELFNPFHFHSLYWSLCDFLNLDYYYSIAASTCEIKDKSSSIRVDLSLLNDIIKHACR
jgi:hypothetical protein